MKRYLYFSVLLFSAVLALFFVLHSGDPFYYSQLLCTETQYKQIRDSRTETGRELLKSLSFGQYPLFYDEPNARWFYSVDPDSPVADPTVSFSADGEKLRIAFSKKISAGKTLSFIAYTDKEYRNYELAVTTLPLIRIESPDDYLTGIVKEDIHEIRFTLFDNRPDSHYPYVQSDGTIHIRGEISRYFEKKNFRVALIEKGTGREIVENQTPLLGLRADGDWILYSPYNDQEKIRNVFTSNLWMESCAEDNSFGLKNGMEYRFVELFWNRQYCGLYALGYPIDAKQMGVQPDVTGHYDEFLFKQKHWGPKTEGDNPEYDGLIIQQDAVQSDLNNGIAITKMYFSMLENGAANGLWNNDEKNILDLWLFIKLIQGGGQVNNREFPGKLRNMYLTVKRTETGTKILFTPWDLDMSWGNLTNTYDPSVRNYTCPYILDPDDNSYELTVNPVSVLREKDDEINRMIRERYAELRADGWSDQTIDRMLDGFERDIYDSGAYVRDMERWPDGNYQDPELGLSLFREYVHERLASMDSLIETLDQTVRF